MAFMSPDNINLQLIRMSVVESDYLKRWVGAPITEALTEVALKRPADPIEYIALWLLKYKENELKKTAVGIAH